MDALDCFPAPGAPHLTYYRTAMKLETQCPKCGFKLADNLSTINANDEFVCQSCGTVGNLEEFLIPDSNSRLNKAIQEAAIKAFSGIGGRK